MNIDLVRRQALRGSIAAYARVGLAVPLYLVLTPFTLHWIGQEQFALWSFSAVVVSLVNLTDLGFKNSLLYHVAHNLGDRDQISRLFSTTQFAYGALCFTCCLSIWLLRDALLQLFAIPADMHAEGVFVLMTAATSFGLRFLCLPSQAVLEAHQQTWFPQCVTLAWMLVSALATFVVLPFRPDVYALGTIAVASNVLVLLAYYLRIRQCHAYLPILRVHFDRTVFRSMLGYGTGMYAGSVMILLREPIFKITISRGLGLAEVAVFEIAFRLCTQLISLATSASTAAYPAAAVLAKRHDDLAAVIRPLTALTLVMLAPIAVFLMTFAHQAISLWLGPGAAQVAELLPFAFLACAIYYSTETLYKALQATGMSGYSALLQAATLATCTGLLWLLMPTGHDAVWIALLSGFSLFSIANVVVFRRKFQISLFTWRQIFSLLAVSGVFLILVYGIALSEAAKIALFSLYCVVHVALAQYLGVVDLHALLRVLAPAMRREGRLA